MNTNKTWRVGALIGDGRRPNVKFFFKERALNGKWVWKSTNPIVFKSNLFHVFGIKNWANQILSMDRLQSFNMFTNHILLE
jgi:hypothetical protein